MTAQNRPPGTPRSAVLLLPNGVEHHGKLRFGDYPQVTVTVQPRLVNVLLVLADQQAKSSGRGVEDTDWMNYARISAAFRTKLNRYQISRTAAQRYVSAIVSAIKEAFALHGVENVPQLIEKEQGMGVRLACLLIVHDSTKDGDEGSASARPE